MAGFHLDKRQLEIVVSAGGSGLRAGVSAYLSTSQIDKAVIAGLVTTGTEMIVRTVQAPAEVSPARLKVSRSEAIRKLAGLAKNTEVRSAAVRITRSPAAATTPDEKVRLQANAERISRMARSTLPKASRDGLDDLQARRSAAVVKDPAARQILAREQGPEKLEDVRLYARRAELSQSKPRGPRVG